MARAGIDYDSSYGKIRPNDTILKLQRTTPYYKRNRAHVCSFYVRGECTRGAECPYRHEMPVTGELSQQNIKDRYYGINDPVALKLLGKAREGSEKAAEELSNKLVIKGLRLKLKRGKPQAPKLEMEAEDDEADHQGLVVAHGGLVPRSVLMFYRSSRAARRCLFCISTFRLLHCRRRGASTRRWIRRGWERWCLCLRNRAMARLEVLKAWRICIRLTIHLMLIWHLLLLRFSISSSNSILFIR